MKRVLATAGGIGALLTGIGTADAQSIIRQPGRHNSTVEFEIHGFIGWHWRDWCRGHCYTFGPGFRVGIPILRNGFIPSINNDVRINFGADVFWAPYHWGGHRGFWYITNPVVMQWNFFLTSRWSVFGEAGVAVDFYPHDGPNCYDHGRGHGGYYCDRFGIWPGFAAGARYHFSPGSFPTLTMRLGFPTGFNIGVSF